MMKSLCQDIVRTALVVWSLGCMPLSLGAQVDDADGLVDPFVEVALRQLARNQGFARLMLPDAEAAVFGTAYYVEEPDVPCFAAFRDIARRGERVPLNSLVQFSTEGLPQPRVVSDWTSIRLSTLIGNDAVAQLTAQLPGKEATIGIMAAAFKKTNAQILFAAREVPVRGYQQAARTQLRREGITSLSDVSPQASGVITPFAQLLVQKFEFDKQVAVKQEAGLVARFLELFGVRIAGDRSENLLSGFSLPTNAVLAIKPGFVQFNSRTCSK